MNRNFKRIVANILSVIGMLALAFPVTGITLAEGEPSPTLVWRDEFALADGWNWVNENPEKWTLTEHPGSLRIYTSPFGSGGENLLLRPVAEGDFSIETRLTFAPDTNFQFAGLILWQDESNFLQFGHAYCDIEGPCVGNGIYFDKVLNGEMPDSNFAKQVVDPTVAYLRLERSNEMVTGFYSDNGTTWIEIGTHQLPEGFQVNSVGLTSAQDFFTEEWDIPADFDYFQLSEWRDEFDFPLADEWYWVNENADKLEFTGDLLRIYTSPYGSGGENLLLRPVAEGDFSIETHMFFTPDTNFQIAGLVIWQDESNFLQFGRAYCDIEGPCVGNGIYFDKVLEGSGDPTNFATQIDNPFDPAEAYLRLERRGDMVRALYSHEGVTWIEIGTHWISPDFQVNSVGLTSAQDFNTPEWDIPADFDYFELTEGWGFLPEGFHDAESGDVPAWACNTYGWAVDPDNREADIAVEVNVDGTSYFANAGEYREDLDSAGVCVDGRCGFSMFLWDTITSYETHNITAYAQDIESGEWVRLYNSPKELTCRTYDIYSYDPLTGETKQITGLDDTYLRETDEYDPTWSPNGKLIAHDVVTSDSHQVYVTDVKTGASAVLHGTEDGGNDAAWSPNGKWIAFDRRWFQTDQGIYDQSIYIVPAAGGTRLLVKGNAVRADWAPNGKRLVFQQPSDGSIRTVAVDGGRGGETLIAAKGTDPAWSPDGNWIVYEQNGNLWKTPVNILGKVLGAPVQVTNLNGWSVGAPTWSTDSQTIIFNAGVINGNIDLWSISAAGGAISRLTGAPVFGDYGPENARNGSNIAYASFSPPAPVTINIWHLWSGEYLTAIIDVFNMYMAEHPNVRINLFSPDDLAAALAAAIPAGEGPDIIAYPNDQVGTYALNNYIVPLDDFGVDLAFLQEAYEPAAVTGVVWQDKIWGLPESQEAITLVYNKAVAGETDFPTDPLDFDGLLAKAQVFYDAKGIPLFCNQGFSGFDAYHIAPLFFGFDLAFPSYVDDSGNVYVNTNEKVTAGDWLVQITPYLLPEMSHMICRDALIAGQVAAWWTGPWAIADLEANGVDYGFVTMGKPFVGIKTLMLSANAVDRGNADLALDIMKFFTGYDMQKYMTLVNKTIPANTAALNDSEVQSLPTIAGFGNNASIGVPMANTPYADLQWGPVGDAVTAIWIGSMTPMDALTAAQEAIEAAIAALMNP